jgi:hypothetical protein
LLGKSDLTRHQQAEFERLRTQLARIITSTENPTRQAIEEEIVNTFIEGPSIDPEAAEELLDPEFKLKLRHEIDRLIAQPGSVASDNTGARS